MLYVWFGETLVWEIWQDSSWTHWIVDWSTWLNADWSACFYGKLKSVPWTSGHLERLQSVQWFSFLRLSLAQMSSFPNGGFLSAPRADDCRKKSAIWSSASALKPDKCDKTFLTSSHPTVGSYQPVKRSRVKCHKNLLNWHFSRAIFRQEVKRFLIPLPLTVTAFPAVAPLKWSLQIFWQDWHCLLWNRYKTELPLTFGEVEALLAPDMVWRTWLGASMK